MREIASIGSELGKAWFGSQAASGGGTESSRCAAGLRLRFPSASVEPVTGKSFRGYHPTAFSSLNVSLSPVSGSPMNFDYSLRLEDFSSGELDITRNSEECNRAKQILCVEMAGGMWKVWKGWVREGAGPTQSCAVLA